MGVRSDVVFVTGGAGFIGSAVARHLLQNTEFFVVNIDKLTYAACLDSVHGAEGHPRYRFSHTDIGDSLGLRSLFERYHPRFVMNLAAESHVDHSIDSPGEFIQTNIVGTYVLLQEALRYWRTLDNAGRSQFRFHHVSTDEVFGSLGDAGAFTEETAYAPNSPYSASKAASDHLARAWRETFGLPTLVTNCSNNYGPFQFPEKLIPLMIIRALGGQTLPVYGDGKNVRDWLYVEDHAKALVLVMQSGRVGETYNIGGCCERSNLDVVKGICGHLEEFGPTRPGGYSDLIDFVADRPGHDRRYAIDASKIQRELGWAPLETFETGLAKTVRWYIANRDWWSRILERGYRAERRGST